MEPASQDDFTLRDGIEGLTPPRIATLYRRAPLLRQTDSAKKLEQAYERSQLVLSVWQGKRLVGVARVLTDGVQVSYLCDLAVEPDVQGSGIGRMLIDEVLKRCKGTELVLRDSNLSAGFYEHLGFTHVENGWVREA